MLMVAVGWQMYELTGSAWDLGLVGLYQFLPALLLTLVAGYAADRVNRARIVAACLIIQLIAAVILAVASHQFDQRGSAAPLSHWRSRDLLLAISVLLGVARALSDAGTTGAHRAAGTGSAAAAGDGVQRIRAAGGGDRRPAIGGMIYVAGAAAVLRRLCAAARPGRCAGPVYSLPPHAAAWRPSGIATLLAGVSFILERKVLLGAISLDLFAVLLGGATALLPMFARDILHVGAWGLGLLRGAPAVGALIMSVVLTRWPVSHGIGKRLLAGVAVFGIATIVFGLSTNFVLSMLALVVTGAADMVSVVIRQTLVQLETPDDMRGRVSAVNSVFIGASNQLGEFESGATAAGSARLVQSCWAALAPSPWRWSGAAGSRRSPVVTACRTTLLHLARETP